MRWGAASAIMILAEEFGCDAGLSSVARAKTQRVDFFATDWTALPGTLIFVGLVGLAVLLNKTLIIDLLTAYHATSTGGMDTVAIIAASSKVDMSFIMAL